MFINTFAKKSDEDLMRLIIEGEARAFTELYERYSKLMVRYFYRMLWKDENKAQDFLHDLFVRLIERPQLFNPDKKFSTWIYSVAHNMCKNEYRKQSFRAAAATGLLQNEAVDEKIDEEIDKASFMKTIDKAMREWPEDDRSLFVLRHELEMTFAEIAAVLTCPEGTVKSRWFYLRKNLAGQFHEFQMTLK
jgi:RNA polymerase sigma-70 factor, ECF subfamily